MKKEVLTMEIEKNAEIAALEGEIARLKQQTTAIAKTRDENAENQMRLLQMDINALPLSERPKYLWAMSERFGLDPLTHPFDVIPGQGGKLILYANRGCAEQLRTIHNISVEIVSRETVGGIHVVKAKGTMPILAFNTLSTRSDEAIGAVPVENLVGDALSNALKKAETQAKRRVTISLCHLGIPDESEIEAIPGVASPTGPTEPQRRLPPPSRPVELPDSFVDAAILDHAALPEDPPLAPPPKRIPPATPPVAVPTTTGRKPLPKAR